MRSLGLIGFALSTYNMNVKAILVNGGDGTGIVLGAIATGMLIISLIWSGWRVLKIDNTLHEVMIETAKTTSLVFIILLGAAMLTAAFRAFGGEDLVRDFLNSLPGGFWTQFIIVMAVIFVLGFFLDFIEIAVVVVPIVAPILLADPSANITAVWLGVMIGLNIQTSFLTPPFGFALFYLRGVAPAIVKTIQIYKGVIAFIMLQLVALAIVGYYPPLVNYLPNRVSFLGETAPPPRNPRLQQCLEEYVHDRMGDQGAAVTAAINAAKGLDLSVLPKRFAGNLSGAFEEAEKATVLLDDIFVTEDAVNTAADAYRPIQREVRVLQRDMRNLDKEAEEISSTMRFMNDADHAERRAALENRIAEIDREHAAIASRIPESWESVHKDFAALTQAEERARNAYRRAADRGVEPAAEFLAILNANAAFFALEESLKALGDVIASADQPVAEETVNELGRQFSSIDGANDVSSALSKARRSLRERSLDREKAAEEYAQAVEAYDAQAIWRRAAETDLKAGVETYLAALADTIGSRQQPKLTRDQALYLASCTAVHRDLSLNF